MKNVICDLHRVEKGIELPKKDTRTLLEKRNFFKVGDKVQANREYEKIISSEPDFNGGTIIEFQEKYDLHTSLANVEMPCGCTIVINTYWLTKFRGKNNAK